MRPRRRQGVLAEELIARFDAGGGQVHHFRGRRACLVSTMPTGQFRVHHSRTGFAVSLVPDLIADVEHLTVREYGRANRVLIDRAKRLPAVTPTLAMLEAHLRAIRVDTIANEDDAWHEINTWCRIVEACETDEAAAAFSWRELPTLNEAFKRAYAEKSAAGTRPVQAG